MSTPESVLADLKKTATKLAKAEAVVDGLRDDLAAQIVRGRQTTPKLSDEKMARAIGKSDVQVMRIRKKAGY